MDISKMKPLKGKKNKSKIIGRGYGSGKGGHTIGRGTKGQKSRKSSNVNLGFEGGQVPLYKRLPHIRGFKNPTRLSIGVINIKDLNNFKDGDTVTPVILVEKKIFKNLPVDGVKILGKGNLNKKLKLKGFVFSLKAKEKIEKSGSEILE